MQQMRPPDRGLQVVQGPDRPVLPSRSTITMKTPKAKTPKTITAKGKTKAAQIISLLGRPSGASLAELMKATGWQAHSVRGFLAGSLKKKGHALASDLDGGGTRRYRLATPVSA